MATLDDLSVHIREVCELPLVMDSPTPGRGNCFFAGVCQQLRRPELEKEGHGYTATSLRKAVCDFALEKEHPEVKKLAQNYDANATMTLRAKWDCFFTNMKKASVFAEGPVLYCAAILLERDIAVMSFGNTRANPYLHVPSFVAGGQKFSPMYLGNLIDLHFQSYIPDVAATGEHLDRLTSMPQVVASAKYIPHGIGTLQGTPGTPSTNTASKRPPQRKVFGSPTPTKRKNLHDLKDMAEIGDATVRNVVTLVKENRRLHAMVRQLEFKLSQCCCHEDGQKVEVAVTPREQKVVVTVAVEDLFVDTMDSVSDEVLLSSPL